MSHTVIFRVPLLCGNCGALNSERSGRLYTSSLGHDSANTHAHVGDVLDLELLDFEDGYFALRAPRDAELALLALEVWGCGVCLRTQTARLRFEAAGAAGWRLAEVSVAVLSRDVLEAAQFISRRLEELAPNPGDDAAGIRDIVRRISQRLGREPGARAGALPPDYLSENCNPVPSVPEFPLTATLDHGAYRGQSARTVAW